jgi:ABC-type branched-subunit amino acid transport system substrate-binding protein
MLRNRYCVPLLDRCDRPSTGDIVQRQATEAAGFRPGAALGTNGRNGMLELQSLRGRLALAGAAAIIWAVAVPSAAQADGAKLGALMPTTGGLQVYGETSANGVRMAVDEVNAAGGVLGGRLELVLGDTQTNPQAGVDAARKLVDIDKVNALVGALSSGVTIPIATTVSSVAGIPQISNASTSPVIATLADNDFLFRTVPSDALQGAILADVVSRQGVGKVSVLYVNNDYGQGLMEAFESAYKGGIAGKSAFEEKQASYRGELARLAAGDPAALVLIAYPGDGIPILRQAIEEGFFRKFVFTDGMKAQEVADAIGGGLLDGAFGTAPAADTASQPAKLFREMYEKKFGQLPPQPFIDAAYDATLLLAMAFEKAGTTDGAAVRDALRLVANPPGVEILPGEFARAKRLIAEGQDIDYTGAAGVQDFDAQGEVPGTYAHWAIRGGKIVDVELIRPNN